MENGSKSRHLALAPSEFTLLGICVCEVLKVGVLEVDSYFCAWTNKTVGLANVGRSDEHISV